MSDSRSQIWSNMLLVRWQDSRHLGDQEPIHLDMRRDFGEPEEREVRGCMLGLREAGLTGRRQCGRVVTESLQTICRRCQRLKNNFGTGEWKRTMEAKEERRWWTHMIYESSDPPSQRNLSNPTSLSTVSCHNSQSSYFHNCEVTQHQSTRQINSLELNNENAGFATQSNQSPRKQLVKKLAKEHSRGCLH